MSTYVFLDMETKERDPFIKTASGKRDGNTSATSADFQLHFGKDITITTETSSAIKIFAADDVMEKQRSPSCDDETKESSHKHSTGFPVGRDYHLRIKSLTKSLVPGEDDVKVKAERCRAKTRLSDDQIHFQVGRDCQLMMGNRSELADASPVFKAMFEHDKADLIQIPDVDPRSFGVLLRYAAKDPNPDITATSVWEVLKVSDKYDVSPLADLCFRFLTKQHPRRYRSHHLCCVLEMAHRLNYPHHVENVLLVIKKHAKRVLKNADALAELCQHCMLLIITADDLEVENETLVHDALLTWTHRKCVSQGKKSPSWKELREVAGDLVKHVRYLILSKHTLEGLRADDPSSCLLTQQEKYNLLRGGASFFSPTVTKRRRTRPKKKLNNLARKFLAQCNLMFAVLVYVIILLAGFCPLAFLVWGIVQAIGSDTSQTSTAITVSSHSLLTQTTGVPANITKH